MIKTADVSSATPGSVVHYTITVTDTGLSNYNPANMTDPLTDVLDDATYNGNVSTTLGTVSFTSPDIIWSGHLTPGGSATITYSVTIKNPDTGNEVMTNTVTSTSAGGNCPSGSTDPLCSATVTVSGLTIVKTASTATTTAGATVGYTITVTNSGQTPFTGVTITDPLIGVLDDASYDGDAAATLGTPSFSSPNLTWTGSLAVGASATITFSVTVRSPDLGNGILSNTITSTTPGSNCLIGSTDARCTDTITVSALTIVKTANTSTAASGATVSYTITVTNSGETAFTGATLTDPLTGVLDDATYNGNAATTSGSVSFTSPNIAWTGNLAVGGVATITYSVTVKSPDTGDHVLANTVTSTTAGSNCASGSTDARCAVTVDVSELTISKTADVSTTTPGSTVHYTITVTNPGQAAFSGATFTDPLTGVLDDATYNGNASATAGSLSYASPNLTWTGNLAIGASATITYSVTVTSPDTGNKILANTLTSAAAGSNCPSGGTDTRCTVTVTVLTPGLTIAKSADVSTTSPGAVVHYTVTVTDTGQTPYTGAAFTDPLTGVLNDATYNADAAATAGSASYAAPNLTWTGNLAVGSSATITYSVTVNNPDLGDRTLANTVTSTTAGSNCPVSGGSDSRCTVTVHDLVPGLEIAQTADTATTTPGAVVHYTVTVTNTGQTAYTGAAFTDPLSGVLDDAAYNANAAATAGTVAFTSPNLTWTGNLAVGAAATVTFSVTVHNPDTGNAVLAATITSTTTGSNCPAGSTDTACTATVQVAQLAIVNQANVSTTTPGGVVRYTATFTNTGAVPYSGITIATDATDVFDDATPNGDQTATSGTLILTPTGVSWTGFIGVGRTVTVTGTVTVKNPDTGNKLLNSAVVSSAPGNNCPAASTDPRCTATVTVLTPALTIVKTADTSAAVPGGTIGYTVTVTDTGQTPYTGAAVTDSFAQMANDAAYNGDAAASSGSLSYASPNLTWSGNLAVGGSVTITYSVTVNNPDTGDKLVINTVTSTDPGSTCPPATTSPSCRITVAVLTPALTIAATAGVATTTPGAVVHYTVTVTDSGQTPYTGATFTDPLTGVLDDAAYNGDAAATAGTVSFASPNLTWTGNLAPGATATITYSVTVHSPDTGDGTLANTVISTTAGSNCASGGADTRCTATVTVAQLTIVNQANVSTTTPGGVVRYTATFTNTGAVPYTGITVATGAADVFDDATPNGDQTATSGTLTLTSTGVSWTGDVPVGGTVTVTGTVTVKNPDTGNKLLTSTLTSSAPGDNCPAGGTDPRCAVTVTVLTPALTITKTANVSVAVTGQTVGYTITVADTGQTPYAGASVTDPLGGVLDDAAYNGDAAATTGTVSFASPNLTWAGSLAAGGSATITYSVTVNNPDTGDKTMANTVSSTATGSTCPPAGGNAGCTATVAVLTPGLTIVKTANTATAVPGATVTYTITVTNTGQVPFTGATVTDPLADVLAEAGYNGDAAATAGAVSFTSPNVTWTGDLTPGGSAAITYSVTVHNPETGDLDLNNAVISTTPGSNCPLGSTDTRCSATVAVVSATTLTFTTTADAPSTTAGSTVHYTVTVANSGLTAYAGATFTDPLTGLLDDAAYNGDAAATAGTVTFTSPDLTWNGAVPAASTVTITYSVTVSNPDTGDKILADTVSSTSADSNCGTGSTDPRCSATVTVSSLAIARTYPATTTPGSVFRIDTTFTNTGQTPYFGITISVDGRGLIDDATVNGDQTATSGILVSYATSAAWTGNIPPGGTVTVTAGFTVRNPDPGNQVIKSVWFTAAPGSNCPTGSTDPGCTATIDVLTPALTITKTANATFTLPGRTVTYTITVADTGQTPYTGATVTDDLTGILNDAAYNTDAAATVGAVTYTSPTLTWTGNLTVGAAAAITYSVTVHNPATGSKLLSNSAVSTDTGSTCPSATSNPACIAAIPVLTPALTITKSADVATTVPGGTVHYTITVADTGQTPYSGATFTDPLTGLLDDASYSNDAAATAGAVSFTGPSLTWTGDLAVGASATITYSVTVASPDTGDHILANTVTSTTPGSNCTSGGTDSRCADTVAVSELAIHLSANVAAATPGSAVVITSTLTNTGQTPYFGISVAIDAIGISDDATGNGDQTATSGTLSVGATGAVWTGDIPAGGTVTVSGSVTVNNPDTGDHRLTAIAASAAPGNNCPAGGTDPACTVTVTVLIPGLTITKTANATAVAPGAAVTYTITVADSGQTPYTGASVTDDLAGVLGASAYNGDATATAGAVSYASPTLTWTGDLAVGASVTVTYSVTVANPATGGKLMVNAAVSADPGSTCPPASQNPACVVTVGVLTPALKITNTADTATATPGSAVHYTITVTNTGQTPYTGATFTDDLTRVLDDATYNADAAATTGTTSFTGPDLTWTGDLAVGASAIVTYSVTVRSPDTGNGIMANTVTSTTPGGNCPPGNTRAHCTATVEVSALKITNTAGVATATPGSAVRYTLTVTNTGQAAIRDANFSAHFGGVVDDASYNGDLAVTTGSLTLDPATVSGTWTGDLAPGASATVTGSFTVNAPDTGDKILAETVDSTTPGSNCPAGSTDPACASTVTVTVPALTITKTADVSTTTPGSVVHFTVAVTDTGQTPYTGATVTDDLAGVLSDATYNTDATSTSGTLSYTSPTITWTGDLDVGATVTITYSVTVNNPDTGDRLLANTVASTAAGSNCPPGGTDPTCMAFVHDLIPALTMTKTADTSGAAPSGTVHYTISITDTGQTAYTGASVTDDLAGVLDDAAYNADAAATTGTTSFTSPDLTWTGDLAVGDTATITYSVTVNDPVTGDLSLDNTVTSAAPGSNCPAGNTGPACSVSVFVIRGTLSITAPASADLGATDPGGTTSNDLGTVTVTDERDLPGLSWTATISATNFTTGSASPAETIPAADATYFINKLDTTTGTATFTPTPVTGLSAATQTVVTATGGTGDTSATWTPAIQVSVPGRAVAGTYTATITHSVT